MSTILRYMGYFAGQPAPTPDYSFWSNIIDPTYKALSGVYVVASDGSSTTVNWGDGYSSVTFGSTTPVTHIYGGYINPNNLIAPGLKATYYSGNWDQSTSPNWTPETNTAGVTVPGGGTSTLLTPIYTSISAVSSFNINRNDWPNIPNIGYGYEFVAYYSGYLTVSATDTYNFYGNADDRFAIRLNNVMLLSTTPANAGQTFSPPNARTKNIVLNAGTVYPFSITYENHAYGGNPADAILYVSVSSNSLAPTTDFSKICYTLDAKNVGFDSLYYYGSWDRSTANNWKPSINSTPLTSVSDTYPILNTVPSITSIAFTDSDNTPTNYSNLSDYYNRNVSAFYKDRWPAYTPLTAGMTDFIAYLSGYFIPPYTDSYFFRAGADDFCQVRLSGIPVVIAGGHDGIEKSASWNIGSIQLTGNKKYLCEIIWDNSGLSRNALIVELSSTYMNLTHEYASYVTKI